MLKTYHAFYLGHRWPISKKTCELDPMVTMLEDPDSMRKLSGSDLDLILKSEIRMKNLKTETGNDVGSDW